MALTPSTMPELGREAPLFSLPDTQGNTVSLADFSQAPALVVMFICNHCPYVKHIRKQLAEIGSEFQKKGVAVVAINSNDIENYPEDSPEKMAAEVRQYGYTFPYLLDESQQIAKAYEAACTPDFFVYDSSQKLAYRGQFDESRPGNSIPVTGSHLRQAVEAVLAGQAIEQQVPSIGCNIKWKSGNEPNYR